MTTRNTILAALALAAAACSDGTAGPAGADGAAALVRVAAEPAGSHCPAGGSRVEAGLDANGNGTLDDAEVTGTAYVCTPADTQGANAPVVRISVTAEPAGPNCPAGGAKVRVGLDANADGVLGDAEVTGTAFVCGGAPGAAGSTVPTLVAVAAEPPGAHCAWGGDRITSGRDLDGDGVLDDAEVTSTGWACEGAPGADLAWIEVTAAAAQAAPNGNYLARSDTARVELTLPPSPAVGDTVRVSGAGLGGWRLLQNAGQVVSLHGLDLPGAVLVPRLSGGNPRKVALADDGLHGYAVEGPGFLTTTADGFATGAVSGPLATWTAVACTPDGVRAIAAATGGGVHLRTLPGAWAASAGAGTRAWTAVGTSADGNVLVAAASGDTLFVSTDGGAGWTPAETSRAWTGVGVSLLGDVIVGAATNAPLQVSADGGATFVARETARDWTAVALSGDGTTILAGTAAGTLHRSFDRGVTWREVLRTGVAWTATAVSRDGRILAATAAGGAIHVSTDAGRTWRARGHPGPWSSVALSSTGARLVAAETGAPVFVSSTTTTPGTAGAVSGELHEAITLQYAGGGLFLPLSSAGALDAQ